jgi:hypothetical protein
LPVIYPLNKSGKLVSCPISKSSQFNQRKNKEKAEGSDNQIMAKFLAAGKKTLDKHDSKKIEEIVDSDGEIEELVDPDGKIKEISNPNITLHASPHELFIQKAHQIAENVSQYLNKPTKPAQASNQNQLDKECKSLNQMIKYL